MPRAGPLRYWCFTLVGVALVLASGAAVVWGTYHLIGTESCGTRTTQACSSETGLHILAVVAGPFVGGVGGILLALRGGTLRRWGRREKRLADRVARREIPEPTVARPAPQPPVPSQTPINRTWPPATWEPKATAMPEATPIERLQQLDELKAKNLISVSEYEAQKKRILGGI